MKHIKKIKIDIDKKSLETIPSVQYDSNTRFLHINLLNGSIPLDLTGCSVKISGTKQDGTAIFNNCTVISEKEGFVEVELTEQMNAVSGTLKCELKIYSANGVLTTKQFYIDITSSITSKEITSGNEFKALTDALTEVQGIDNKFGEVYEHLDNKASKDDVAKISSGTPLFANNTSEMKDITKNYVNTTDGYLYIHNDGNWIKTNVQYQATGIDKNSISVDKTTFFELSKNLFNVNTITKDYYIDQKGVLLKYNSWSVGDFIAIDITKKYKFVYLTQGVYADCPNLWIACYDRTKKFLKTIISSIYNADFPMGTEYIRISQATLFLTQYTMVYLDGSIKTPSSQEDFIKYSCNLNDGLDNIKENINEIDEELNLINNKINLLSDSIENYWLNELNKKIDVIKINEEKGTLTNTLSFAFITDMHYPYNFRKSTKLLKYICDNTNIKYILNGGDSIENSASKVYENVDAVKVIYEMRKDFKKYGLDEYTLNTLGNHDLNTFGGKGLSAMQMHDAIYKTRANYTNVGGWCYYYEDDTFNKIRFIQINTYSCNQQQLDWFCNALEVPSTDWHIVIFSHALPYTDDKLQNYLSRNSQYIKTIIDGYINRTKVMINDNSTSWGININKSFANSKGSIVCFLAGHVHVDNIKKDVINYVTTVNDSKDNWSFAKIEGTISEQCFDILTICKNTRTVYVTRIGHGENRQFTY